MILKCALGGIVCPRTISPEPMSPPVGRPSDRREETLGPCSAGGSPKGHKKKHPEKDACGPSRA